MLSVIEWRDKGLESYFTIDAGPNVHVICQARNAARIKRRLIKLNGIKRVIINKPSIGARLI